jgi:hypothetical protein
MISATGKLGLVIITLGRHYFVLSCRLAPTNIAAMQDGRRAAARPHVFDHVTPSLGVGSEAFWARLFSGLLV